MKEQLKKQEPEKATFGSLMMKAILEGRPVDKVKLKEVMQRDLPPNTKVTID